MLTSHYKDALDHLLSPLALRIARIGIHPSAITLAIPLITGLLCLWVIRTKELLIFSLVMTFVGCFDGLDGAVARAAGKATKWGAYLDALCDRYVEAMVVGTLAYLTDTWLLSLIVLFGAQLFSYAKARAAMEVPVENREWPDFMERTERGLIYMAGLAAKELLGWHLLGRDLFWWTLLIVAGLLHLSVIQRILRARQFILARTRS